MLNDAVYSDRYGSSLHQLTEATKWLERKIAEEGSKRPEQVERYRETLKLLKDRISDNHGMNQFLFRGRCKETCSACKGR